MSLESTFTTQLITLYSYDAPVEIATRVFELFLIDGAQVIVDLAASLIEANYENMMRLEELDLMHYMRKDIVINGFKKHSLKELLQRSPLVELYVGF